MARNRHREETVNLICDGGAGFSVLIDNHRAIPVYLIHKTGKIADVQVNRHEKYPQH